MDRSGAYYGEVRLKNGTTRAFWDKDLMLPFWRREENSS
jgi:hypothetical protein